MTRLLARLRKRDEGFTLAEVLVTTMLMTVVFSIAMTALVATQRVASESISSTKDAGDLRVAFGALNKTVRAASKLDTTTSAFLPQQVEDAAGSLVANKVQGKVPVISGLSTWFYANTGKDGRPQLIRYYLSGTSLIEEQVSPAEAVPPFTFDGTPRRRTLARNVVVPEDGGTPVFTYYSQGGTVLNPAAVSAHIGDAVLVGIGDVGISLTLRDPLRISKRPTTFVQRVRVINADVPQSNATPPATP